MRNPDPDRLPVSYEEWEKAARHKLEDGPFYYVKGGAGGGRTMDANVSSFNRWQIVPRMLNNVDERDQSIQLFGQSFPSPILHAPIGTQSVIHKEGELGSAKACAELGIPYIASSASTFPMEKSQKLWEMHLVGSSITGAETRKLPLASSKEPRPQATLLLWSHSILL